MSAEETAPYGSGPAAAASPAAPLKRVRTHHLREMKQRGEKFTMLTAYEQYAAQTFDEAGIDVLLVGDSATNNVFGNETSLPVTVDELIPLVRAVTRSARRALVVADLPFGSYQASPEQAYLTAVRFMKEANAHAVKLEGGLEMAPQVAQAHRGRHPGDGAHRVHPAVRAHPRRLPGAGPWRRRRAGRRGGAGARGRRRVRGGDGDGARRRRRRGHQGVSIPTIGIGAGVGLRRPGAGLAGRLRAAHRPDGEVRQAVRRPARRAARAAREYAEDVRAGTFPGPEHTF